MEIQMLLATKTTLSENPPPKIICSAEKSPWSGISP